MNGNVFHNLHLNEISTNSYNNYNWQLIMNANKPIHGNSMYLVEERFLLRMPSLHNSLLHVMFSFSSRNIYRCLPFLQNYEYSIHSILCLIFYVCFFVLILVWFGFLMTSRSRAMFLIEEKANISWIWQRKIIASMEERIFLFIWECHTVSRSVNVNMHLLSKYDWKLPNDGKELERKHILKILP